MKKTLGHKIPGKLPLVEGRRFKRNPQPFIHKGHDYGIVGRRGWYQFIKAVEWPNGTLTIECWGPFTKNGAGKGPGYHSLDTNEIGTVERALPRTKGGK